MNKLWILKASWCKRTAIRSGSLYERQVMLRASAAPSSSQLASSEAKTVSEGYRDLD